MAVGLRRRWVRLTPVNEPWLTDDVRLIAERIFRASDWSTVHFSSSEDELPQLSDGVTSDGLGIFSMIYRADRCGAALVAISRRGECSESEEKLVRVGATGEPSDFLDKKPVRNLLERGLMSREASGGIGMGEELFESGTGMRLDSTGGGNSTEELVGVDSIGCGVAWNSARVPSSVSSLHRTPRLRPLIGDFFLGVNWIPFFATPSFRLLGDAFTGEEVRWGESTRVGIATGRIGDGPMMFTGFLLLGVPWRVGGNTSVTGRPPSGLITCDVASEQDVTILESNFLAA